MPLISPNPTAGVPALSLRRRQVLAASGANLLLAAGCMGREPLRIGFLGGMSGRVSDLGIGARNGIQLGVDEINAVGGLMGRQIELLVRDDEQSFDKARLRLTELYDQGVEWVIGPMTSNVAAAVLPLVNQRQVPMISPLAGANDFSGKDDAFFRVVSDSAASAAQQAQALLGRGLHKVVTVADIQNAVFTRNWCGSAGQTFAKGGGELAAALEYESAPGFKFAELAQRVVAAQADCVVIAASASDSAVLAQRLRLLQPRLFIALSVWAGTEGLPALGGRALDGVIVTQFFDRFNRGPRWLSFVQRYQARFGEVPGYPSLNAYDALQMGVAASRAMGPDSMLAALRRMRKLDGLQRPLRFDEFGDCLAPTYVTEIKDGRYVAAKV